MENTTLEQKIMKQVVRVHYLKKVFNPLMFKAYILVAALLGMASLVSVANVFKNMPSFLEVGSLYNFTSSAIVNTELSVQLVLGAVIFIVALLIKDTIQNFSYSAKIAIQSS